MESSPNGEAVQPLKPPYPYLGGKRNLSRRIVERIESVPHRTYAEPFLGGGGVFLRRRTRAQAEVVNDLSLDVATFYRVLQRHYVPLMDMLKWQVTSRAEFERLAATDPATLTDLERAVRFLYLQKVSFGGKVTGRAFGVSHHQPGRFDVAKLAPVLDAVHARLTGVIIERLPWQKFVERYDAPETFFYLDPPYWGCENDYGADLFSRSDSTAMREVLGRIKGRFLLSLNATPDTLRLFAGFDIEQVKTTYGITAGATTTATEILVSGGG